MQGKIAQAEVRWSPIMQVCLGDLAGVTGVLLPFIFTRVSLSPMKEHKQPIHQSPDTYSLSDGDCVPAHRCAHCLSHLPFFLKSLESKPCIILNGSR